MILEDLLRSGQLFDLILLLIAFEIMVLMLAARRWGIPKTPMHWLPNLASGAALMLGIKLAIIGSDSHYLLLTMTAALLAHVIDVALRVNSDRCATNKNKLAD